ncbi:MAG: hypothetical protein CSA68_06240 [Rhodobacterales bacterium]|nr:MAG: hypothetical protein CSA68_06240 [Rhodobacterales bacterium]
MSASVTDKSTDRGITLLELVIAILVLSIGTVSAFRVIDHAQRNIGGETARLFAYQVAQNRAEMLRLTGAKNGRSLPKQVTYGPYDWQVDSSEARTAIGLIEIGIKVHSPGQPGAFLVTYVTAEPLAEAQ